MHTFAKAYTRFGRRVIALVGILSLLAFFQLPNQAQAVGTIIHAKLYLSRQQADVASGVTMQLFFTAVSNVSAGGKVVIIFPSGGTHDTKWCRAAGSDLVATGITDPTGGTESATALTSSSSFSTACSQTPSTITISNVAAIALGTKYGVQIVQAGSPTALLGTASAAGNDLAVTVKTQTSGAADVDSGTIALSVIGSDQIAVTAAVTQTLSVSLSGTSAALGALDTTHVNQAGIVETINTNASGGYISLVKYDHTLTSGTDTIADVSGTTTLAVNNAGYGASSSQAGNTVGVWSPTSCATTTSTTNVTQLTTAFQSFASAAAPVSNSQPTLCFVAAITGTTPAGAYTSTATLVTTGRF